ncbi:hypothetical protein TNCV_649081 [Trichonephila clavipes]|nr:hypothetical protein TNCV_649081 [Trichonephila clavipes]
MNDKILSTTLAHDNWIELQINREFVGQIIYPGFLNCFIVTDDKSGVSDTTLNQNGKAWNGVLLQHRVGKRDQEPAPFSLPLRPARRREKKSSWCQMLWGRPKARPRNSIQNAGAECTCDVYFHKDADSQLGGGKHFNQHN